MSKKKRRKLVLASNYKNALKVARFEYKNVGRVELISNRNLPNKQYKVVAKQGKRLIKK